MTRGMSRISRTKERRGISWIIGKNQGATQKSVPKDSLQEQVEKKKNTAFKR